MNCGPVSPGVHQVLVRGLKQSFRVEGRGPLCVVHPGGPGLNWDYLRMPLLEQHLTLVYLEPVGVGASGQLATHPEGYTVERYADQLRAFLDALAIENVFLLGHSHGGFVVQQAALADPRRLSGLILYSSSAVTGEAFMQRADAAIRDFAARAASPSEACEVLAAWERVPAVHDDATYTEAIRGLLPAYFADHGRVDIGFAGLRRAIEAAFVIGDAAPFDVRADLARLALPALVVTGEHDFICGPHWAAILMESLPNATLQRFTRSGHLAHIEQAAEFAEAVLAFARSQKGAALS